MNDLKKERLILVITTLACISCILQNNFGNWEFWVPYIVSIGIVGLWAMHFAQKMDMHARTIVYFIYSAFLVFYHGIHDTSLYEVSVSITLFLVSFTILDNTRLINLILLEYVIIMALQFNFLYKNETDDLDAFLIMRIVFHIGCVIALYVFCRITISGRLAEKERLDEWHQTVDENDRDMEDFLANISHELRTPVNVINGMTALLNKDYDREELDSIKKAGIRLSHQIEDVQDYTEIKRGELLLEEENYMCISLINDVITSFRAYDSNKDLELVVDIAPETPAMLKGDIRKLHKLFRHLLDNAVKFTHKGGINIKVFPVKREYGINLMIEVRDTGIGMTRADMSRLTKGMYQANKKRNRSTGGIGIGIPIVYGIVHRMGGFVKIESRRGEGTTVRLSIPQKVVDDSPCLSLSADSAKAIVLFIKPEKYSSPQLREFNRAMAVNLAKGLKLRLYSTGERDELLNLLEEIDISHIFTEQSEYESERGLFEKLTGDGYKIIVSADNADSVNVAKGVVVLQKPLYGFSIVRMLNDDYEYDKESDNRVYFEGVKALIVDDEPMNLIVASGLLKEYGFVTDTAESGKEAIHKYENGEYDVIFMDHMMPEMDGVEAMKNIRHVADVSLRHPVIIALTANALSGAKEMFIKEGFDGFIAKPIDIGEFERVMKSVLSTETADFEGRDE